VLAPSEHLRPTWYLCYQYPPDTSMTRAEPPSSRYSIMITALETMICISAIAGSVRFAKAEYDQMRRTQQVNRALAYAVGSWLKGAK